MLCSESCMADPLLKTFENTVNEINQECEALAKVLTNGNVMFVNTKS